MISYCMVDCPGRPLAQAMVSALVDPTAGVVAQLQSEVIFGASLYTSAGGNAGGTCPVLTTVNPAMDNYTAIDGLMRGDLKSRYDSYAIGRNNGWLSANDIRRLENMNPLPPEQGDVYLIPLNMVPAGTVTAQPPSKVNPTE